tara:strand:+ start:205 stop:537 length:333 start_codon:yes stop_codon:yes gene_type:complete
MNEGWICPNCKTIHNPSVKTCNCISTGVYTSYNPVNDKRRDDTNKILILSYIQKYNKAVTTGELKAKFCNTKIMSRQTLQASLKQLEIANILIRPFKGVYVQANSIIKYK